MPCCCTNKLDWLIDYQTGDKLLQQQENTLDSLTFTGNLSTFPYLDGERHSTGPRIAVTSSV